MSPESLELAKIWLAKAQSDLATARLLNAGTFSRWQIMKTSHQLHESRSLRMHRMVAERFRQEPAEVIQFGLQNLERWRQQGLDCDDFKVWTNLLFAPPTGLIEALTSASEMAVRLRQSSPFAGLIPEETRRHILASPE